jgi:hypothetical protein
MTHPFITHNGGPCPVSPEAIGGVEFRDGTQECNTRLGLWSEGEDWWQWQGDPMDNIIAYRLHQPDKGEAS